MDKFKIVLLYFSFGLSYFFVHGQQGRKISEIQVIGGYSSIRPDIRCFSSLELKSDNKFVLTENSDIPIYQRRLFFFKIKTDYLTRRGNWKLIGDSIYLNKSTILCLGDSVFYYKIHDNESFNAGRIKKCFDLIGKNQTFESYCRQE